MSRRRAVTSGRRILSLDVLGEVRRAMRILRRVERYLAQQERAEKRAGKAAFEVRSKAAQVGHARRRRRTDPLELGEQG